MDPAARAASFGAVAAEYERGRPGYPADALRACLPPGARRALDLGAGTGKVARGLLALGLDVVAVEPAAELRALIPPAVEALAGSAETIPLPDDSVDAVLAGQAFHWFDRDSALPEMRRVLRPGGRIGLLWNLVDDRVGWAAAYADLLDLEDRLSRAGDPDELPGEQQLTFAHEQPLDADGLVANAASRSVVSLLAPAERAARLDAVRALAPEGAFALPYVCHVRVAPA